MSLLSVPVHPLQTTCWSSSGQCRKGPSERGNLVDMYDVTTKYITTAMLVTDFVWVKIKGWVATPATLPLDPSLIPYSNFVADSN